MTPLFNTDGLCSQVLGLPLSSLPPFTSAYLTGWPFHDPYEQNSSLDFSVLDALLLDL